jgi:hypothetical protein
LAWLVLPMAAGVMALAPASASAALCGQAFDGAGASHWYANGGGGEFDDVEALFGSLAIARGDAFDGYGVAEIDGNAYDNPDPNDAGCTRKGRTLKFPGDGPVADIRVRPELYVSGKRPLGRQLVSIRNTGNSPVTFDFGWDGDLGSDSDTNVANTSSGDALVAANDRWATSCDDTDADGCGNVAGEAFRDLEVASNWERKGQKKESADVVVLADGDSNFDVTFEDITLQPGKTKVFMEIVHVAKTIKSANRAARKTEGGPGFAFAGLKQKTINRIQNW